MTRRRPADGDNGAAITTCDVVTGIADGERVAHRRSALEIDRLIIRDR